MVLFKWNKWISQTNNFKTGTRLDEHGYDWDGYRFGTIYQYCTVKHRVGKDGFNRRGFNKHQIHKITATQYDPEGFDVYGFNVHGLNKYTGTKYDTEGYDINGLDQFGYPRLSTFTGALHPPSPPPPSGIKFPPPPFPPIPPLPEQ